MNKDPFNQYLEEASQQLRSESGIDELRDFERGVWTEIALHDEHWASRVKRLFQEGFPVLPLPAVAGGVVMAMMAGVLMAFVQADAYGESVSDSMEARYVASIHPVLRSQSEKHQHSPNTR